MKVFKFIGALLLALGILLSSVAIASAAGSHKTITVTWHRPKLDPEFPQYLGTHPLSKTAICQIDVYYQDTAKQRAIWHKLRAGKVLRIVNGKPADSAIYKSSTVGPCTPVIPPTTTRSTPSTTPSTIPSSPSSPTTTPTAKTTATTPVPPTRTTSPTTTVSASTVPSTSTPGTSSLAPPLTTSRKTTLNQTTTTVILTGSRAATAKALPNTGVNLWPLAGFAALLLTGGAALLAVGRRRNGARR